MSSGPVFRRTAVRLGNDPESGRIAVVATLPRGEVRETFPPDQTGGRDLTAWLGTHADTGARLDIRSRRAEGFAPALRMAGYQVVVPGRVGLVAKIGCLADAFSLSGMLAGRRRTTDSGEVGRREAGEWLAALGPVSRVDVEDPYGRAGDLVASLAAFEWPLRYLRLTGPWRVGVEVYPDRLEASAAVQAIRDVYRGGNDPAGFAGLVDWLGTLSKVDEVAVRDAASDSVDLAAALERAGFTVLRQRATRGSLPSAPGARHGQVQAELSLHGVGWLDLTLWLDGERLHFAGSYMGSPWIDTLVALTALLDGSHEVAPGWVEEPGSHRLVLTALGDGRARLHVRLLAGDISGDRSDPADGELDSEHVVVIRDLAAAFSDASHVLLDLTDPVDLAARWNRPHPADQLGELDRALGLPPRE